MRKQPAHLDFPARLPRGRIPAAFGIGLVLTLVISVRLFAEVEPNGAEQLKKSEALWKRGYELIDAGRIADAIEPIEQAVRIERAIYGDQHERVSEILSVLADLHELQRNFTASLAVREELVNLLAARLTPHHWRVIDARIRRDDCRQRSQMTPETRQELERAVVASQKVDGLFARGRYAEALGLAEQVLSTRRKLLGPEHLTSALSLARLAAIHSQIGNLAEADSLYTEAIRIEESILGPTHPELATTLSNLAVQCDAHGEPVRARQLYTRALQIRRDALGVDHPVYAGSLNNLAVHAARLHNPVEAEALYRQALDCLRRTRGELHAETAMSLSNLGRHLQAQGDLAGAEPLLTRALEVRGQVLGPDHPDTALSRDHLAELLVEQNKTVLARAEFEAALRSLERSQGRQSPAYATVLGHLAELFLRDGDLEAAEKGFRQALAIQEAIFGAKDPHSTSTRGWLARTLWLQQRGDEARELARQAVVADRVRVEAVAAIQSDRQQFESARQSRTALETLLTTLDPGPVAPKDYEEVLQVKGRVLRRQRLVRALAHASSKPELARTALELKSAIAAQAQHLLNVPEAAERDTWQKRRDELTRQVEAGERALSEQSDSVRRELQPVLLQEIRQRIPDHAVLVDFIEFLSPVHAAAAPRLRFQRRLVAFVVRPGEAPIELVAIGPTAPIAAALDTWRQSLGARADGQAAGQRLRQLLWEPLLPLLGSADLVLVSPDGLLGRLPWNALPGSAPGTYLLEDVAIATIPCVLALPGATPSIASPASEGNLLLVGNVDFDGPQPEPKAPGRPFGRQATAWRGADWKRFQPLEGTRGELASLEKIYRDEFGMTGITVLERTDANEERFCREAVRHKALHVATHGFFAPAPLKAALGDASRGGSPGTASEPGIPPGLMSGLALAGANREPAAAEPDGILTALEVECLDLRGVELAVLSACETGLGETAGGEGLLGLQRAFQVAGAQTVVASLWEVPDVPTRTLMERFYMNLLGKRMGTLAALREAQLWMLREGPRRGLVRTDSPAASDTAPPQAWAAFVLSGDWR